MFSVIFYYVRQLAIFRFLWWLIRNLWPFLLFAAFWPVINGYMSRFPLWREMLYKVGDFVFVIQHTSAYIRITDFIEDAFRWMFGEIRPTLSAIGNAVKGFLS